MHEVWWKSCKEDGMVARIAGRSGVVERHTPGPLTLLDSASHQGFLEEYSSKMGFFHSISHQFLQNMELTWFL